VTGPLHGIRIIEMGGIGPAPLAAMIFADLGADVIRVDRKGVESLASASAKGGAPLYHRGRPSIALHLKVPAAVETLLGLVDQADALIEGFRPGVMERLGVGPDVALARNPRLVYGRMTGWGQTGPLAQVAGHDINYIALSGALGAIGGERPTIPLNLVGDFGGGSMFLAVGVLAALLEAKSSGKGQVVDAAMTDGAAVLMTMFYGMHADGMWRDQRGTNMLDGGAHFYNTYETADAKWISIGSIEPAFYAELRAKAGLADKAFDAQWDPTAWPKLERELAAIFKSKTRDEWCALLEGSDACFAPVLSIAEAPAHAHNAARGTFVEHAGRVQPAPAPRFSRTPGAIQRAPSRQGADTESALRAWGVSDAQLAKLKELGGI
jgi:alpha-methylacyl-CoA racemase